MTIKLYQLVALTIDLPQFGLKKGETAYVIEHYPMSESQEDGYSLEGFDIPIEGITVEVRESQIRPLSEKELKEVEKNYSSIK
jgi:chitinase